MTLQCVKLVFFFISFAIICFFQFLLLLFLFMLNHSLTSVQGQYALIMSTEAGNEEENNTENNEQQFVKNESSEHILKPDEQEQDGFEMVIELPRDILTAYILCQLTGVWSQCSTRIRVCIWFGLYGSYTIQFAVFFSLVADLDFSNFDVAAASEDWWFNLVAIAVLFMYLWRDVIAFYNSVWVIIHR